ncbi:MAG TPA: hypothetical protein V6C86_00280 [Oculatellaceae cyanobacterium]
MSTTRRDLEKEKLWRELVTEWKHSPETVTEFCRLKGLNEHTFRFWQREILKRDAEAGQTFCRPRPGRRRQVEKQQDVSFAPVTLVENHSEVIAGEIKFAEQRCGSIEIITPRGYVVRLPMSVDVTTLQLVFRAIQTC